MQHHKHISSVQRCGMHPNEGRTRWRGEWRVGVNAKNINVLQVHIVATDHITGFIADIRY